MQVYLNHKHPRDRVDGKHMPFKMCVDTGRLTKSSKNHMLPFEELGISISIYFKLLKAVIFIFFICTLVNVPLYIIYSSGDMNTQA